MPDLARGEPVADAVRWDEYSSARLRLRVSAPAPDTLILAEVAYPGWVATVNGEPVPIGRAATIGPAAIFRSIAVPAGTSSVELRYRPFARVPLPIPEALGG
jgi:hypothetical protein